MLIAIIGVIASCNKFEHETQTIPNCELCDYAETLEGSYRGASGGIGVPNYDDSVTISVAQVFAGNSQYEDSTLIRLKVDYDFDSSPTTRTHTIQLLNDNGDCKAVMTNVFGPSGINAISHPQGYYQFTSDSLR